MQISAQPMQGTSIKSARAFYDDDRPSKGKHTERRRSKRSNAQKLRNALKRGDFDALF